MKIAGRVVTVILVIILASIVFVFLSPGYDMHLVRSESMVPSINMGDMVITGPLNGPIGGEVEPGNIVTYQRGQALVTHRVLSVDGNTLATKADAMDDPDPWTVTLSDVKGVYLFKIPYIGYASNFIRTRVGWFLVIILCSVLSGLLIHEVRKHLRKNSEKLAQERG